MPDLPSQIRSYIDAVSPPIGIDEAQDSAAPPRRVDPVGEPERSRTRWLIGTAVAAAVVLIVGIALMFGSRSGTSDVRTGPADAPTSEAADSEGAVAPQKMLCPVFSASTDIAAGTTAATAVDAGMVSESLIPAEFVPSTAIRDLSELTGIAVVDIQKGSVLVRGIFEAPTGPTTSLPPDADAGCRPSTAPGENPTDASWRLLGDELAGYPYRTGIATDAEQYADLWTLSGLTSSAPAVDFETEIVVWFGAVYGSSCPIAMDEVVINKTRALVHGDFSVVGGMQVCTSDARAHAFVVAIERSKLPNGPFTIQLSSQDPPPGAPEERTVVNADLSVPGAVVPTD